MVYCPKCGTKNKDDAEVCKKCGESLYLFPMEKEIEREVETCFGPRKRRPMEEECFGLPRAGTIFGIVIGLMIILVGIVWMIDNYHRVREILREIAPIAVIILGILILAGALYGLSRR